MPLIELGEVGRVGPAWMPMRRLNCGANRRRVAARGRDAWRSSLHSLTGAPSNDEPAALLARDTVDAGDAVCAGNAVRAGWRGLVAAGSDPRIVVQQFHCLSR